MPRWMPALPAALAAALLAGGALAADSDSGALDVEVAETDFWDGFYLGILGGAGTDLATGTAQFLNLGAAAGVGATTIDNFYFGAEAFIAAETYNGSSPYLWLAAAGRLGAVVGDDLLLFGSTGVAYDAQSATFALTAGAGAEFALDETISLRGQYEVQYYPDTATTYHEVMGGVFWHFE